MELERAKIIAQKLVDILKPFTSKILIAGSVRRNKPIVKDIEICALPLMDEVNDGLFDKKFSVSKDFIRIVNSWYRIKGEPTGKYAQRRIIYEDLPKILFKGDSIVLDLFIPTPEDFWRQACIRTGSSEYSRKIIAGGWLRAGWCGTENGLRLQSECVKKASGGWECVKENPTLPPAWDSEEAFFSFLGIKWIEPENRNME